MVHVVERCESLAPRFLCLSTAAVVGVPWKVVRIRIMRLYQRGNLETKSRGDTPSRPRIVAAVRLLSAQYLE